MLLVTFCGVASATKVKQPYDLSIEVVSAQNPYDVTVSVKSKIDLNNLTLEYQLPENMVLMSGERVWQGAVKSSQTITSVIKVDATNSTDKFLYFKIIVSPMDGNSDFTKKGKIYLEKNNGTLMLKGASMRKSTEFRLRE